MTTGRLKRRVLICVTIVLAYIIIKEFVFTHQMHLSWQASLQNAIVADRNKNFVATAELKAAEKSQCSRLLFSTRREVSKLMPVVNTHKSLPRLLQKKDMLTMMSFLERTATFLRASNVAFCLDANTLLGSYVMHHVLPRDDVVQFVIRAADMHALQESADVGIVKSEDNWVKLYDKNGLSAPAGKNISLQWPFVDARLYADNATHVWTLNLPLIRTLKTDFYPLHDRPLGSLWLPSPRNSRKWLLSQYKAAAGYVPLSWQSMQERKRTAPKSIKWPALRGMYPTVVHSRCGNGTKAAAWYNGVEHYNVYIDEPCTHETPHFGL